MSMDIDAFNDDDVQDNFDLNADLGDDLGDDFGDINDDDDEYMILGDEQDINLQGNDDIEFDNDIFIDNTLQDKQQEIIENMNEIRREQNRLESAVNLIEHTALGNRRDINNNQNVTQQLKQDTVQVFINTGIIKDHGTGIFGMSRGSGKHIGQTIKNTQTVSDNNRNALFSMRVNINKLHNKIDSVENKESENNININKLQENINQLNNQITNINNVIESKKDEYIDMQNTINETINRTDVIEELLHINNNMNNINNQRSPIN
eukprot:357784_1